MKKNTVQIEFRNVTKQYQHNVPALEQVSLTIEKGEFVFVVGKSGSGKSTFLKLLSCQMLPTSGAVVINKECTSDLTTEEIPYFRRQFGIMQMDMELLPDLTLAQNIRFAMRATEQPGRLIKQRIRETLSTVGVAKQAEHYPEELSAGEIARALLARAIVVNPKILVLDEPTANLSPALAWDIMCLLDELNRLGITVVVASHARELVTIMKKRVVTLVSGVVVSDQRRGSYDVRLMDRFEEARIAKQRAEYQRLMGDKDFYA